MGSQMTKLHLENDQQNGICVNALLIVVADTDTEMFYLLFQPAPAVHQKAESQSAEAVS